MRLFKREPEISSIKSHNIGRASAEIVITALKDWKQFSINDNAEECVKLEEQYLLAFTIGHIIEDVLKDTPEGKMAITSYYSHLEKKLRDTEVGKTFYETFMKSRANEYQQALKKHGKENCFIELGRSFARFCGNAGSTEIISEGSLFFAVCCNSLRNSLASVNVEL